MFILRFLYFCHVLCHDYYSIHFPSFLFILRHLDLGTKIYKWPQENGPQDEIKMAVVMEGPLSKWTNVVKGWQYRWFVLDDNTGLLSYYTVSVISLRILITLDRNCSKKTHLKNVPPEIVLDFSKMFRPSSETMQCKSHIRKYNRFNR